MKPIFQMAKCKTYRNYSHSITNRKGWDFHTGGCYKVAEYYFKSIFYGWKSMYNSFLIFSVARYNCAMLSRIFWVRKPRNIIQTKLRSRTKKLQIANSQSKQNFQAVVSQLSVLQSKALVWYVALKAFRSKNDGESKHGKKFSYEKSFWEDILNAFKHYFPWKTFYGIMLHPNWCRKYPCVQNCTKFIALNRIPRNTFNICNIKKH